VHIELTDHLRCPRDHPEAFLVLLPDRMLHRQVVAGHLGCPVCGWSTAWTDSVPDFGDGWQSDVTPPFDAAAAHALLGLEGAGGWVALAGNVAALAAELGGLLPGVSIVAVNSPGQLVPTEQVSFLQSGAWPLKAHSMRGIVLGEDTGRWCEAALGSVLPGLRLIGSGDPPSSKTTELLGNANGVWIVKRR
jgi:hypothetical protein